VRTQEQKKFIALPQISSETGKQRHNKVSK